MAGRGNEGESSVIFVSLTRKVKYFPENSQLSSDHILWLELCLVATSSWKWGWGVGKASIYLFQPLWVKAARVLESLRIACPRQRVPQGPHWRGSQFLPVPEFLKLSWSLHHWNLVLKLLTPWVILSPSGNKSLCRILWFTWGNSDTCIPFSQQYENS